MASGSLATFEELQTYMPGVTLDEAQAEMLLQIASGTIRSECGGQVLTLVEDDALVMRGVWSDHLLLPQRPVRAVSSLSVDGVELAVGTAYKWTSDGRVTFYGGWPPAVNSPSRYSGFWGGTEVLIGGVYDHGYPDDEMPWDIKGTCLDLARRAILTPDAGVISQESLGSYSVSYSRQIAATLTRDERRKLRPYRFGQTTVRTGP